MIRSRKFPLPPFALSLSARLLVLTIAFVMLAEILIYAPSIANFRINWLSDQADSAHLAALALEAAPAERIGDDLKAQLLARADAYAVALRRSDRHLLLYTAPPPPVDITVDLGRRGLFRDIAAAFVTMARSGDPTLRLISPTDQDPDLAVEVLLNEALLRRDMTAHSRNILLLSIIISLITGTLLYFSLQWMMVRPMRRITEDIPASLRIRATVRAGYRARTAPMRSAWRNRFWPRCRRICAGRCASRITWPRSALR